MPKPIETKQRILNAAIRILERDVEENLRIADICKKAGVSAPSVYHFFADRAELIDSAFEKMFSEGQLQMGRRFVDATYECASSGEFAAVIDKLVTMTFSPKRRKIRRRRASVLGRSQFSPNLAKRLANFQHESNKTIAEGLRFAQAKGWITSDVDPEMFAAWFIGIATARVFIEFDGQHRKSAAWDEIALRSIFTTLNLPRPTAAKRKKATQRKWS